MPSEVIRYAEVTSTNDLARDHARRGAAEGTVVVARYQTSGRGRLGRDWYAPYGKSLLMSLILRPPAALAHSAWLTLIGGIAAAEAIKAGADLDVRLKWPNDVRHAGRKLAGVLTETQRQDEGTVAVVGIGINVDWSADDLPEELAETATSLRLLTQRDWSLDELLAEVRRQYLVHYRTLLSGEIAALRRHWSTLDETLGKPVLVDAPDGTWRGKAVNLDEHGALWVEDVAGGQRRVVVGDVSISFEE